MTGDDPAAHPAPPSANVPGSVRIVSRDDLERSRLTVFFRLFLAIPHLLALGIWGLIALMMAVINWFAILFTRRPVPGDLQVRYVRYLAHVEAYLNLAASPFPPFAGAPASYPVDLEIDPPAEQNRWKTGFRLVLAVPAIILGGAFGAAGFQGGGGSVRIVFGVIATAALLAWFAALARGRMPHGLRDLLVYAIGYSAQVAAYILLVTDRYPNSDPRVPGYGQKAPDHVVRIRSDDDLRRSRLTVFFRLFLWLPHMVWLILWGLVTALAVFANWFVTLFAGRPAAGLHRFISAYLRYQVHALSFLYLVANPFPGFGGREGSYPVDITLPAPGPQNRWKTGFRLILAFPAMMISGALGNALSGVALLCWFAGLFTGRMPLGLRNLGLLAMRYHAQVGAYIWLLTDDYPFSGPSLELRPLAAPAPEPS
jgi:hypothetical protein